MLLGWFKNNNQTKKWTGYLTKVEVPDSEFVKEAEDNRWSNRNLDPIPPERCTWNEVTFISYWACDLLAVPLWSTTSTVMTMGFTAKETIPITFIGYCLCGLVITGTAKVGACYKIPFPVAARASFGMWGSLPVIFARSFIALMWLAILNVTGGQLIEQILIAIWPSFAHFHNPFPQSANITASGLICFFIYWLLQTATSYMSIEKIRIMILVKAIVVPPTFLALCIWALVMTKGGGDLVRGQTKVTYEHGDAWAWVTGISHVAGLFSSLSVNMPDFGRYSRSESSGISQLWAFPLIGTLGSLTPVFVTDAGNELWGEVMWDFPALLAKFDNRAAKFFVGFAFVISNIGCQVCSNIQPFSSDVMALWPRKINRFRALTFGTIFCVVCLPWNIINSGHGFINFLSGYSSYASCLAIIIVADFFVVKKLKLNVQELYKTHGIYAYSNRLGVNWKAYLAFSCGFLPALPGFIWSVQGRKDIQAGWQPFAMAWLFGTSVSSVVYLILCYFIRHPADDVQEAVKPHDVLLRSAEIDSTKEKECCTPSQYPQTPSELIPTLSA